MKYLHANFKFVHAEILTCTGTVATELISHEDHEEHEGEKVSS
jgi:hypothetical protein